MLEMEMELEKIKLTPIEAIKLIKCNNDFVQPVSPMGNVPKAWENTEITLLHKKGDTTKLENYRPISLLSTLYKLFKKIITKRNTKKFDFYQLVEQLDSDLGSAQTTTYK